jgi:hypothetical protein
MHSLCQAPDGGRKLRRAFAITRRNHFWPLLKARSCPDAKCPAVAKCPAGNRRRSSAELRKK